MTTDCPHNKTMLITFLMTELNKNGLMIYKISYILILVNAGSQTNFYSDE